MIIAGSGMCTGGRVKHHLAANISRPESTVLFVGYQAVGTLGRHIVSGAKRVRILGQHRQVRARIVQINGFSAHADSRELFEWISGLKTPPRRVFVVHGEYRSARNFASFLKEKTGWRVSVPAYGEEDHSLNVVPTLRRLLRNNRYVEGVIAQFFYVGAQIMCWTFIIHYGTMELGLSEVQAQGYNMVAMVIFVTSRFICTFLLKYVSPGGLLLTLALGGGALTLGTIFIQGMLGLYCLVGVSACMSLMFPTIYGIALKGVGEDAKLGAAGLIMAILGGSVMPPVQGAIIDLQSVEFGGFSFPAVRASFVLVVICFIVIAHYGWRTSVHQSGAHESE